MEETVLIGSVIGVTERRVARRAPGMAGRVAGALPALLLLLGAGGASAQSVPRKVYDDVRWALSDALFVLISPVYSDGRDWATVGLLAGATGLSALYDDELDAWIADHPESAPMELLRPFREESNWKLEELGSGSRITQASAALYLAGLVAGSDDLRDAGVGCMVSEKLQSSLRHGVYRLVSRRRPLTADGDPYMLSVPGGGWEDHSFFGGHGANIMTCAAFLAERFELGIAEPVLLGAALGVGLARVADRRHWISDAVVGTAFGYALGKAFADRQRARERERAGTAEPEGGPGGAYIDHVDGRLLVGWRRRF